MGNIFKSRMKIMLTYYLNFEKLINLDLTLTKSLVV